jgi:hypothetical protein
LIYRRALAAFALVASVAGGAATPARADTTHQITFRGAVPCAALCSYWPVGERAGFTPCEYPFPAGSFIDIVTEPAPAIPAGKTHAVLQMKIYPTLDWDSWICAVGTGVGNGTQRQLAQGAHDLGSPCDNILGSNNPVATGCQEKATTPATPGTRYVLRAYNWSDPGDCPGEYTWIFI